MPGDTTSKDLILAVIAQISTAGGQGYVIEYRGSAIRGLSMGGRMTICNMSIEAGARAGMIAPDATTFAYLIGRPHAPKADPWQGAVAHWSEFATDEDAVFDHEVIFDATTLAPFVTWGTNPGEGAPLSARIPSPEDFATEIERESATRALEYMGLSAGTLLRDIEVQTVFLDSCTNGHLEDLRSAAKVLR